MSLDPRALLKPIVALGVLVLITAQTQGALKRSGVWGRPKPARVVTGDPFGQLDRDLALVDSSSAPPVRDPLAFGAGAALRVAVLPASSRTRVQAIPGAPPPVLTAIVWDEDPTASIRLLGHDYTVRVNSLFADYLVTSIARDQVVLSHDGASLVLKLQSKGDSD